MNSQLKSIIAHGQHRMQERQKKIPIRILAELALSTPYPSSFIHALNNPQTTQPKLIAEIKKASPSRGIIAKDFDPIQTAGKYASGAVAFSVLTEQDFFLGDPAYLQEIARQFSQPVLRKDFITDPYQIIEARSWGAAACLLIAAILSKAQLDELLACCREYKLEPLVEIHTLQEYEQLPHEHCPLIGINNRDLNTFEVDINRTLRIAQVIPSDKTVVAESGYFTAKDLMPLNELVDAVLIGEGLVANPSLIEYFMNN